MADRKELDQDEVKTPKKGRQSMGLSRHYVLAWTLSDAFREFFQNWVDAMAEKNQIPRQDIQFESNKSKDHLTFTAYHLDPKSVLGFLRHNDDTGYVEICNYGSTLTIDALSLGVSTKRGAASANQAGVHGEGLKVAALIYSRKGYVVRIESAKFYWRFALDNTKKQTLYCQFTPIPVRDLDKKVLECAMKQGEDARVTSNPSEDVIVKIGNSYSASKSKNVSKATFTEWIKCALHLNCPKNLHRTETGEIILDQSLNIAGKIFLKGLLVGGSTSSYPLRYAYNLYAGEINRDRKNMGNAKDEARAIANIWGSFIQQREKKPLKLTDGRERTACQLYLQMLLENSDGQIADVQFANLYITEQTARLVWEELKADTYGNVFFYNDRDAAQAIGVIEGHLKKKPSAVPSYLDFKDSHRDKSEICRLSKIGDIEHEYPCDHTIVRLYEIILNEVTRNTRSGPEDDGELNRALLMRVVENLEEMPRQIQVKQGMNTGELCVTWKNLVSHVLYNNYNTELDYRVTVHRESTCSVRKTDLLATSGSKMGNQGKGVQLSSDCGCPYKTVYHSHVDQWITFTNLLQDDEYFPMISRPLRGSFYGLPPRSVKPTKFQTAEPSKNQDTASAAIHPETKTRHKIAEPAPIEEDSFEELRKMVAELEDRKEEINLINQKLSSREGNLKEIRQQLSQKNVAIRELAREREEAEAGLTSTIEDLQQENQHLKDEQTELESQVKTLKSTISTNRPQVSSSNQGMKQPISQQIFNETNTRLHKLEKEIIKLRNQRTALLTTMELCKDTIGEVMMKSPEKAEMVSGLSIVVGMMRGQIEKQNAPPMLPPTPIKQEVNEGNVIIKRERSASAGGVDRGRREAVKRRCPGPEDDIINLESDDDGMGEGGRENDAEGEGEDGSMDMDVEE